MYLKQALFALIHAAYISKTPYKFKPENRIFNMTKSGFEQAWTALLERAGINTKEQDAALGIKESQCGLEFRDLRREAGSRFDEAGLTKMEHGLMLGHANQSMASIYIAPHLNKIVEKLDSIGWLTLTS